MMTHFRVLLASNEFKYLLMLGLNMGVIEWVAVTWSPSVEKEWESKAKGSCTDSCNRCGYDFVEGMVAIVQPVVDEGKGKVSWYNFYHPKCVMEKILVLI